ncbi:hypothetical protein PF003_g19987 [Phytophthora fragariae]|nr:hypothetical protein PF003_g19987 [Phytophthora fragariae]
MKAVPACSVPCGPNSTRKSTRKLKRGLPPSMAMMMMKMTKRMKMMKMEVMKMKVQTKGTG